MNVDLKNETEEERAKREKRQAKNIILSSVKTNFLCIIVGYLSTAGILALLLGAFYLLRENLFTAFLNEHNQGVNPTAFAVIALILAVVAGGFFVALASMTSGAMKEENARFMRERSFRKMQIKYIIMAILHALIGITLLIFSVKAGISREFESFKETIIFSILTYPFVTPLVLIGISMWVTTISPSWHVCPNCHLLYTMEKGDWKDVSSKITTEKLRGQYHFGKTEKIGTLVHMESGTRWDIERKHKGYFEEHNVNYRETTSEYTERCKACGYKRTGTTTNKNMISNSN